MGEEFDRYPVYFESAMPPVGYDDAERGAIFVQKTPERTGHGRFFQDRFHFHWNRLSRNFHHEIDFRLRLCSPIAQRIIGFEKLARYEIFIQSADVGPFRKQQKIIYCDIPEPIVDKEELGRFDQLQTLVAVKRSATAYDKCLLQNVESFRQFGVAETRQGAEFVEIDGASDLKSEGRDQFRQLELFRISDYLMSSNVLQQFPAFGRVLEFVYEKKSLSTHVQFGEGLDIVDEKVQLVPVFEIDDSDIFLVQTSRDAIHQRCFAALSRTDKSNDFGRIHYGLDFGFDGSRYVCLRSLHGITLLKSHNI